MEVIMRVPGLFIIDYWWQKYRDKLLPHSMKMGEIVNCFLTNLVLLQGFLLLLLPRHHLKALYKHFVRGVIIISCHFISRLYIESGTNLKFKDDRYFFKRLTLGFIAICNPGIFGVMIIYLDSVQWRSPSKTVLLVFSVFAIPVIARLANTPRDTLQFLDIFCSAAAGFHVSLYIIYQIPAILDCVKQAYIDTRTVVEAYDISTLFTMLWNKLFVPTHFALFWLTDFFVKLIDMYLVGKLPRGYEWYNIILTTISSVCATPITLVATSVSISYLSYFTLCSTWAYLQGFSEIFENNPSHSGQTEGLTMFWHSILTGLIEKKMPARKRGMKVILFIVLSNLLKSMLGIAEPFFLALGATGNRSLWQHLRALSFCLALLIFPLYLVKISSHLSISDFWMSLIVLINILTSIQVLELLVVYSLYLYDSARYEPWENLDDTVYYTIAVTKVLEFFVAIFQLGNYLWDSAYDELSWLKTFNLSLHYFNILLRIAAGWESYRRKSAEEIKYLPSASKEQLAHLDYNCSVCFNTMKTACITPCQHFFHRTCIRKWLHVKETCPLCNSVVSLSDS